MRRRNPRAAGFRSSIWRASPTRSKCRLRLCMEVVAIALRVICNSEWAGTIPKGNGRMLRKPGSNFLFITQLKSFQEDNEREVNGALRNILSPTPRENCFFGTYPARAMPRATRRTLKKSTELLVGSWRGVSSG